MDSLGSRLRAQRERRHLDLTAIAEETKIKASLLDALERDDLSYWPGGIFRRAWVRAYARAIGLDPEVVVREFQQLHPDPVETLAAEQEAAERARPTGLRRLVSSAMPGFLRGAQPAPVSELRGAQPASVSEPAVQFAPLPLADPIEFAHYSDTDFEVIGLHREPRIEAGAASEAREAAGVAFPRSPDHPESPHLPTLATLCGRIARAEDWREGAPLLADAARVLESDGLVLWAWQPDEGTLRACAGHGYADAMLARLPEVRENEENAIAEAFRSGSTAIVAGGDDATGALAVPLTSPAGTLGVLALEFRAGREQQASVRASAEIIAAQFARL